MQLSKILGAGCAVAALFVAVGAGADSSHYAVAKGAGGTVTVTPQGGYHVNKAYPWKLTCGSNVIKFTLSDSSATASGASGTCDISGAVCQASNCEPFHASVSF